MFMATITPVTALDDEILASKVPFLWFQSTELALNCCPLPSFCTGPLTAVGALHKSHGWSNRPCALRLIEVARVSAKKLVLQINSGRHRKESCIIKMKAEREQVSSSTRLPCGTGQQCCRSVGGSTTCRYRVLQESTNGHLCRMEWNLAFEVSSLST